MPARTSASSSASSSSSSSSESSSDSFSRSITSSFLYTTLVTLSCVCLFGVGVDGTHFQFGSITWTRTSPVNITNPLDYEYTFSMISGWRQCYQPFVEANGGRCPTIGNIVNVGSYFFFQGTTSPVGANFAGGTEISDWTNYGQIPRPSTTNVPITAAEKAARIPNTAFRANVVVQQLQVSADDPGSNWFVGTNTLKIKLGQVNSNLPAGTGNTLTLPFTLMFMHCCRISTLLDGNNDRLSFVGTIVNQGISSPVTTSRIREYAFLNVPIVYSIPGTQLDRHPLRYSFTPATSNGLQSQLVRDFPSNQISNGAPNVDPITGKLTWIPTRLGLVAMQFSIKDTVTDSVIVLDIVFQVTDALNAPEFISPIPSYDFSVAQKPGQFPGYNFPIGFSRTINIRAQDSARNTQQRGISAMSTITTAEGITFTFTPNRNEPNGIGTGQLTYTAKMNSTDINVCFSCHNFLGVPVPSVKQYCITLIPGGNVIVATGIVRDFHRKSINDPRDVEQVFANLNNVPDFDIGQNRDTTTYVTDRLDENGLPIFKGGNGITITNTSYQDWWKTDSRYTDLNFTTSQQQTQLSNRELINHTIVLTSGVSTDSRIYTFRSENFNPIDGQLFGNELDDNNYFFTYEIHTFIDYRGGEILEFWSSDDLFVYFDYVLEVALPGTGNGSIKKQIIALDDTAMGKRKVYGKYRCDIFYAQRSRQNDPVIQIQLPATQSTTFRPPITTRPPTTLPPTSTYPPTDIPTTQPPTDPPTEPPTSTPTPVVPTIPVPVPTTFTWINPKERTWIRPLTSSVSFVYNNPPHNIPLYVRVQDRTTLITSGTTSSSIQVSADVTLKGSNQLTSMTVEILRDDQDGTPIAADHIYTQVVTRSTFSALAIPDPMPILNAMANSDDVIVPAQACPQTSNTGAIVGGVIAAMSVLIILTNIATHVITKRHQQKVQSTPAPIIETWQANPAIPTQEGVMV